MELAVVKHGRGRFPAPCSRGAEQQCGHHRLHVSAFNALSPTAPPTSSSEVTQPNPGPALLNVAEQMCRASSLLPGASVYPFHTLVLPPGGALISASALSSLAWFYHRLARLLPGQCVPSGTAPPAWYIGPRPAPSCHRRKRPGCWQLAGGIGWSRFSLYDLGKEEVESASGPVSSV